MINVVWLPELLSSEEPVDDADAAASVDAGTTEVTTVVWPAASVEVARDDAAAASDEACCADDFEASAWEDEAAPAADEEAPCAADELAACETLESEAESPGVVDDLPVGTVLRPPLVLDGDDVEESLLSVSLLLLEPLLVLLLASSESEFCPPAPKSLRTKPVSAGSAGARFTLLSSLREL